MRSTSFIIAGRIEMGRLSDGSDETLPLGMGVTSACFQFLGIASVTKLELTFDSVEQSSLHLRKKQYANTYAVNIY